MRRPILNGRGEGRLLFGLALGLLLVLAGCQELKLDAALQPAPAPRAPAPPLELAWRADARGAFGPMALLPTRDAVLVGARQGGVSLLNQEGRSIGYVSLGDAIEGPFALVDGRRLIVALDGKAWGVVAYDIVAGRTLWKVLRRVAHPAGVVVAGQTVVAPARDGRVRGLDLQTGAERWQYQASGDTAAFVVPPVLLADGSVAVADVKGRVAALDPTTGQARWTADVGAPVYAPMGTGGGVLTVPSTRSTFTALDAATGAVRWLYTAPDVRVRFGASTVDDAVYVGASDGLLRRFNTQTGEVVWSFTSDGHVTAAPLVMSGLVYAGTLDERLVALDAASGEQRWAQDVGGRIRSAPIVWGQLLVVTTEPQHVRAYRVASGGAPPTASR